MEVLTRTLRHCWRELTRPRSLPGFAASRSRRGIAILVVVSSLMVITVLVTELAYTSRVRFMVAAHERDRVQAYWLARSGINFHTLILVANKEIGKNSQMASMMESVGIPAGDGLWQMLPSINTGLLRMLMGSGGSIDDIDDEAMEEFKSTGKVADEFTSEEKTGLFDDRSFLDFDGDFSSEIKDHESRINVNAFVNDTTTVIQESPTGMLLYALMSGPDNDQWFHERNIERWEVIGNLKDWVDTDTLRSGGRGGYEDTLYNTLDPPYLTKNAPFDSIEEIRLVAGWEGELCDRFCEKLSVYGDGAGKLNINTMPDEFVAAIARACQTSQIYPDAFTKAFQAIEQRYYPFGPTWAKPEDMVKDLVEVGGLPIDTGCAQDKLISESQTFTITATGLVGTSSVDIEAVLDFSGNSNEGKLVYWRVR